MRYSWGPAMVLAALLALPAGAAFADTRNSLVEDVEDGPAADLIRKSLRLLEEAEAMEDRSGSLALYREGKDLAERAITIDERDPNAHFALFGNWGRILQHEGYLKNAHHLPTLWRELDRAIELDPNHAAALGAKGGLYLRLPWFLGGSVTKAEPLLERAIVSDPNIIGARLELAECYLQTNRRDEAQKLAAEALRIARRDGKERYVSRANALIEEIRDASRTAQVSAQP